MLFMLLLRPHSKIYKEPLAGLRIKIWLKSLMHRFDVRSPADGGKILDQQISSANLCKDAMVDKYLNPGTDPIDLPRLLTDLYYLHRSAKKHVPMLSYIVGRLTDGHDIEQQLLSLYFEGPGMVYWSFYFPSFIDQFPTTHEGTGLDLFHNPGRPFFAVPAPRAQYNSGSGLDPSIKHAAFARKLAPAILSVMCAFDLLMAEERSADARRIVSDQLGLPCAVVATNPLRALDEAISNLDAVVKSERLGTAHGFAPHEFATAARDQAFYLAQAMYGSRQVDGLQEYFDIVARSNHHSSAFRDFFQGYPSLKKPGGHRGSPKIDVAELKQMLATGHSKTEIARHFKCSRQAIYRAIYKVEKTGQG